MTQDPRLDTTRTIRAPRGATLRQELAHRSGVPDAHEQSRSGSRRAARGAGGLRRHRPRGAQLGVLRPDPRSAAATERRRNAADPVGQAGGRVPTHADAPRVLLANSNLVPNWATWEHFNELDRKGLMMYGQMTAGSWIYIGSQGIVQGTYETFVEAGRQHFGGDWRGKWILTAGLGGMGGAQPLAATMAGASMLAIECDPTRIEMRLRTRYLDRRRTRSTRRWQSSSRRAKESGLGRPARQRCGNRAGDREARRGRRDPAGPGHRPDLRARSGQRLSARPAGRSSNGSELRAPTRRGPTRAPSRWRCTSAAMLDFQEMGIPCVDYGNNIRQVALDEGVEERVRLPGLRAGVHPAAVLRGHRPVPLGRAVGRPGGHLQDRPQGQGTVPGRPHCITGSTWPGNGSRSRACRRASAGSAWASGTALGLAFNEMVARGEVKAPIVIGRDHLDSGSVASPNRETEAMRTAPTRCRTGRCSTRCSTPPAARPGSASIMAAASAWATRSMRAW